MEAPLTFVLWSILFGILSELFKSYVDLFAFAWKDMVHFNSANLMLLPNHGRCS